ncbi:MAG: hypothetical protein L0177_19220, partial [Chloroflexi bacterium]|nr:hypothetical protein [Chloroflexota bacterium]
MGKALWLRVAIGLLAAAVLVSLACVDQLPPVEQAGQPTATPQGAREQSAEPTPTAAPPDSSRSEQAPPPTATSGRTTALPVPTPVKTNGVSASSV